MAVWSEVLKHPERDWGDSSIGGLIASIVARRCQYLARGGAFSGEEGDMHRSTRANPLRPRESGQRARFIEKLRLTPDGGVSEAWELSIATEAVAEWDEAGWDALLHAIAPDGRGGANGGRRRDNLRAVLNLRFTTNMSWPEIASTLGLAKGTPQKLWLRHLPKIEEFYRDRAA